MRKLVSFFFMGLMVIEISVAGYFWFLAYMLRSLDPTTGIYSDGFGRPLHHPPLLISMMLMQGNTSSYAGIGWVFVDILIFLAWCGLLYLTFKTSRLFSVKK